MKHKNMRITEKDFLLANRRAAREEEIAMHGKQVIFRSHIQKSKKAYDRRKFGKAVTGKSDDGFFMSIGLLLS